MTDITHTEFIEVEDLNAAISATEQKQIDKAIAEIKKAEVAKVNKTDMAIADMQAKYLAITITGINDREAYIIAQDGYKIVRNHRLAVERKRKELVEFPNKYLKAVNGEATRIKDLLTPIEEHLKLQVGVYEQAEAAEKERLAQERRAKLTEAGFKFDGAFYVCGMHTISTTQLVDMDEERLAYYVKEGQAIIAAEKAAEQRRLAEIEAQKAAAAALEADRKAFEAQKAEFARQQAEQLAAMEKMRQEMEAKLAALQPKPEPVVVTEQTIKTESGHEAKVVALPVSGITVHPEKQNVIDGTKLVTPTVEEYGNAPLAGAPSHMETADQVDEAIANSGRSFEYIEGFEDCKQAVLAIFADPTPRKRGEFVEAIKLVKP